MTVSHYVPWRAIRAGEQLSDSKGASAALSTEMAIQSVHRAIAGFQGPKDIFRNPDCLFRVFEPQKTNQSPFDLHLTTTGDDFAVMGMHFKLGLYEHQSASAIHAVIELLSQHKDILYADDSNDPANIQSVKIKSYNPALQIIGDPAKRNPTCRQSADHSMVYIVATLLRKAFERKSSLASIDESRTEEFWKHLMLSPKDYSKNAIWNDNTRQTMEKITFEHGGPDYDALYPEGIPTSVQITTKSG